MSSSNVKSPIESIIGGKNKADDNDNDSFDDDTRSHKKSEFDFDINLSLFDTDFNADNDQCRYDINKKRKELGSSHYETIQAMNSLAEHYLTGGTNVRAKLILVEIENILKSTPERNPVETIKLLMLMAKSYSTNALDDSKSKAILLDCYTRWCALPPEDNYDTSDVVDQLAAHFVRENNYVIAVQLLNKSYEVKRRCRGSVDHDTLITMYELAKVDLQLQIDNIDGEQNFDKAVSLLRRCLRKRQLKKTDDVKYHDDNEKIMNTLAEAYTSCGKQEEANLVRSNFEMKKQKLLNRLTNTKELQAIDDEENMKELEVICLETESSLGANHMETLELMSELADAYIVHKKYDKAEIVLNCLLDGYLGVFITDYNYDTVWTLKRLVKISEIEGKYLEQSRHLSQLKSIWNDRYLIFRNQEIFLIRIVELLARSYCLQEKYDKAIVELKEVIALRKKSTNKDIKKNYNMNTNSDILRQYCKLKDATGIIDTQKYQLQLAHECYGKCALITFEERNKLAGILIIHGESTEVEILLNDFEILNTDQDDIKVFMQVLYSMDNLSTAYENQGKMIEATSMLETSLNVRKIKFSNNPVRYTMDLETTDNEDPVEITAVTNSSETYLNEEKMRLLDKNSKEIYGIRIHLSRMYLSMNFGSKAIEHLNNAKEEQHHFYQSSAASAAELDDLFAAAKTMGGDTSTGSSSSAVQYDFDDVTNNIIAIDDFNAYGWVDDET